MAKGRRLGSKNFSPQQFTQSRLKGIWSNMNKAIERGVRKTMVTLAPNFLEYVAKTEPEFNDYTGNLLNAYSATLYVRKRYVKTFFHDTGRHGKIHIGKKPGSRWAELLPPARHGMRGYEIMESWSKTDAFGRPIRTTYRQISSRRKPSKKRYLKRWEREDGYQRRLARRGNVSSAINSAFGGNPSAQNVLMIQNTAPYAVMVQQGKGGVHRHYRVLRSAALKKMTNDSVALVKAVTSQELRAAGFKIRKNYPKKKKDTII